MVFDNILGEQTHIITYNSCVLYSFSSHWSTKFSNKYQRSPEYGLMIFGIYWKYSVFWMVLTSKNHNSYMNTSKPMWNGLNIEDKGNDDIEKKFNCCSWSVFCSIQWHNLDWKWRQCGLLEVGNVTSLKFFVA